MDASRERRGPFWSSAPRSVLWIAAIAIIVALALYAVPPLVARRGASEPSISRSSLVLDTVTRGTLERSVSAPGVLQPDRVSIVASASDGTVRAVPVRAGAHVEAGTIVARLDDPDARVAVADAEAQLDAASADLRGVREEAVASTLDARAALRTARAEESEAQVTSASYKNLYAQGLIGTLQYRSAVIKSGETHDLTTIADTKIAVGSADADAKVAAAEARVQQLAAALDARRAQLATLVVTAGAAGTIQSVAVDPGQRVTSGTELARIAGDRDLKAVLAVAEGDLHGVSIGMPVRLTASDGTATAGLVARFAPAAENGSLAIDIALSNLPPSWRPAENLTGTIVLGRAARVLSIARPAGSADDTRVTLYRLDASGKLAYRTDVVIGTGTDERVRVRSGLAEGERVIVSDTSALTAPTLRLQE